MPTFLSTERTDGAPRIVGSCGLGRRPSGAVELGYWIARAHWGRGFALEAGLAAARDLFERTELDRVYAGVDPSNVKSLRALAKTPGVRKVADELFELTPEALLG